MRTPHPIRSQRGSAMLIAMLVLVLMGMIGLASLDTVMRDRQIAGYQKMADTALYAADAGVAKSLDLLHKEVTTAALAPGDCLSAKLGATDLGGGIGYAPDPSAPTDEICMLASAEPCAEVDASIEQGQPVYLYTVWNVRVEGTAPGGATARVQATAERCHAFNN